VLKPRPEAVEPAAASRPSKEGVKARMMLLRTELGDVLRTARLRQNRTLRDVATTARVSLGYLSEIERGQKEASSELLASVCEALGTPLWVVLHEVSDRMAEAAGEVVPDTVPVELTYRPADLVGVGR
jgi:transcriptional regulator with XRE-family HTH domain